jgi:uncharacterized protein (TIGR03085 family)
VIEPVDQRERRELCDLFVELGPDAPTLCAGWTAADLAAHLFLREHFRRWGSERITAEKARGFSALVDGLRRGAPLIPWRVPGVRTFINGGEYFIHHEDLRRANGLARREDRPDLDALLWRMTGLTGRRLVHRIRPFGVELRRPDGTSRRLGRTPAAVLSGEASELVLYQSGRKDAAKVTLTGPDEAVAAVEQVRLGL